MKEAVLVNTGDMQWSQEVTQKEAKTYNGNKQPY